MDSFLTSKCLTTADLGFCLLHTTIYTSKEPKEYQQDGGGGRAQKRLEGPHRPLAATAQPHLSSYGKSSRTDSHPLGVKCPSPSRPLPRACLHSPSVAAPRSSPYLLFPQCAAVSTQLLSTRTPAQWNERPLKRDTCQGCEPRAHGAPETTRSKPVSFLGSSTASAAGDSKGAAIRARRARAGFRAGAGAGGRGPEPEKHGEGLVEIGDPAGTEWKWEEKDGGKGEGGRNRAV